MVRLVLMVAALVWGLTSCQPGQVEPDRSADPSGLPIQSVDPGRPMPTIEIPPPR